MRYLYAKDFNVFSFISAKARSSLACSLLASCVLAFYFLLSHSLCFSHLRVYLCLVCFPSTSSSFFVDCWFAFRILSRFKVRTHRIFTKMKFFGFRLSYINVYINILRTTITTYSCSCSYILFFFVVAARFVFLSVIHEHTSGFEWNGLFCVVVFSLSHFTWYVCVWARICAAWRSQNSNYFDVKPREAIKKTRNRIFFLSPCESFAVFPYKHK